MISSSAPPPSPPPSYRRGTTRGKGIGGHFQTPSLAGSHRSVAVLEQPLSPDVVFDCIFVLSIVLYCYITQL